MNYFIKVTSKSGIEIEINGKPGDGKMSSFVKRVSIKIDTVQDNPEEKSTNVFNKVELELTINNTTKEICKKFMDWALNTSEDVYREVYMNIYDNTGENNKAEVIRSFNLKDMFVEDCFEDYSKVDKNDTGLLTVKLIQQAEKHKEFIHDVNEL